MIEKEQFDEVLHVLKGSVGLRGLHRLSVHALRKGKCDLVFLNLFADSFSPPQKAHVLEEPSHAEGEVALYAALTKALFVFSSNSLDQLLEYLISLNVLCKILELSQTQVPRPVPIDLVKQLHEFAPCQVDTVVCEHQMELIDLDGARAIVVDVAEDPLYLLIAQDLVFGLKVFFLDWGDWGISKCVRTALLQPLVQPAYNLWILTQQLRIISTYIHRKVPLHCILRAWDVLLCEGVVL